jgi:hypothetical protein
MGRSNTMTNNTSTTLQQQGQPAQLPDKWDPKFDVVTSQVENVAMTKVAIGDNCFKGQQSLSIKSMYRYKSGDWGFKTAVNIPIAKIPELVEMLNKFYGKAKGKQASK